MVGFRKSGGWIWDRETLSGINTRHSHLRASCLISRFICLMYSLPCAPSCLFPEVAAFLRPLKARVRFSIAAANLQTPGPAACPQRRHQRLSLQPAPQYGGGRCRRRRHRWGRRHCSARGSAGPPGPALSGAAAAAAARGGRRPDPQRTPRCAGRAGRAAPRTRNAATAGRSAFPTRQCLQRSLYEWELPSWIFWLSSWGPKWDTTMATCRCGSGNISGRIGQFVGVCPNPPPPHTSEPKGFPSSLGIRSRNLQKTARYLSQANLSPW